MWWSLARRVMLCWMTLVLLLPAGCSRQFWRFQADEDVYEAIGERLNDPRWAVPRVDIDPDPRSRFFDPHDPDCSPLPPDDPAAHTYMHWVDGWEGYKGWHKFGDLISVENPQWLAPYGIRSDLRDPLTGDYLEPVPAIEGVTLQDSVELSLIHSREYQNQLENVYLSALDVTFDRFQFGVRYLINGGAEPNGAVTGSFSPEGGTDRVSAGAGVGISQLLPTGTQLALDLTNNTLWLFSGSNKTQSASVLSYSITQPLLFGAGRKVGLETLTQSERQLLYDVRSLSRFRQQFFTDIVGAGNGGYLGLLQTVQQIRNEQGNIRRLEEQVARLQSEADRNKLFAGANLAALPPGFMVPQELAEHLVYNGNLQRLLWRSDEPITDAQVALLRSLSDDAAYQAAVNEITVSLLTEATSLDVLNLQASLASSINRLRGQQRSLQDALDSFKIQLGLPPDMVLTVDEELLRPFEIISNELTELENASQEFVNIWGQLNADDPELSALRETLVEFSRLMERSSAQGVELVSGDFSQVDEIIPQRLAELPTEEERRQFTAAMERARFLFRKAQEDLGAIRQADAGFVAMLKPDDVDLETRLTVYEGINLMREDLLRLMQNLQGVQANLRIELIDIADFKMSPEEVVRQALENRVDLMNTRGIVMDLRRRVEVAANALLGSVDVVVDGDIRNQGGNKPLNFSGERSDLRVGMRFTTPVDQINERNAYRTALINYQRARRDYMAQEDAVKQQVRRAWRQLIVLRQNLETSRRALRLSALQYDSAVEDSNAPKDPRAVANTQGSRGLQGSNILSALNGVLQNQNQLLQNWIDYERNRLIIYRDMGIMEIGPDGLWNDGVYRKQNDASDEPAQIRFQSPTAAAHDPTGDRDWRSGVGRNQSTGVALLDGAE
ncbi:MAG: TolC family protein [Planctomycetaceae bacterium]|nr:TolC family protein [Planctomycetaceae bacterium]